MVAPRKIVLHSLHGYRTGLEPLVADWIREGVKYVGVIGVDATRIEEAIDDLCTGDGSNPYFMLTASHGQGETLADAVLLAEQLSDGFDGPSTVVEF
ncbi:hypothetical protein [Xanthomonas bonasiae]|uniref:hypothetical protein n=1 Tax=Xanthomonas bonasiae TaxID=2810351 RepID=UPI00177FA784|nr:hypothetical protein [Xanthomonas surreyensis]MBD7923742.1 hypothetical protein [Xanthomonas surreyensis]